MTLLPYRPPTAAAINAATHGGAVPLQSALAGSNTAELLTYAARLVELAGSLTQLVTQLEEKRAQLREIWPEGSASERNSETTATALSTFLQSIQPMISAAQTITTSAQAVQAAQGGLTGVLSSVNPVVQSLLSSPWGHGAGRALAHSTVGSLSGFLSGIGSLLGVLGDKDLGTLLTSLGTLASGIDQMVTALGGNEAGTEAAAYAASGYGYPTGQYDPYAGAYANAGQYPAGQYAGNPYAGQYATNPYAGQYAGQYATDPYTGQQAGGTGTYGSGTSGSGSGSGSTGSGGAGAGSGGGTGGAGSAVGDWIPVDAPTGGTDTGTASGSGGAGTDGKDGATEVTVSSGGETVSFSIDADEPTTITAEVGAGDGTEVVIAVRPDRV